VVFVGFCKPLRECETFVVLQLLRITHPLA
jgi:hypothetical protein